MKRGSPAPKLGLAAQCGYKIPCRQLFRASNQETRWKSKSWPQEGPRASCGATATPAANRMTAGPARQRIVFLYLKHQPGTQDLIPPYEELLAKMASDGRYASDHNLQSPSNFANRSSCSESRAPIPPTGMGGGGRGGCASRLECSLLL